MQLIELFLPIYSNKNKKFSKELFQQTYDELVNKFGGLTVYSRVPMQGFWQKNDKIVKDELIIYEVMDENFSSHWWCEYRVCLEKRFQQERLIIRTHTIQLL
ncbi:MAG: hypothetical protein H0U70_03075 [Tatlockia sp.]|nr:hypothetical protein [Tatlockia sp.]